MFQLGMQDGESLWSIAQQYGITVKSLREANRHVLGGSRCGTAPQRFQSNVLLPGERLDVPLTSVQVVPSEHQAGVRVHDTSSHVAEGTHLGDATEFSTRSTFSHIWNSVPETTGSAPRVAISTPQLPVPVTPETVGIGAACVSFAVVLGCLHKHVVSSHFQPLEDSRVEGGRSLQSDKAVSPGIAAGAVVLKEPAELSNNHAVEWKVPQQVVPTAAVPADGAVDVEIVPVHLHGYSTAEPFPEAAHTSYNLQSTAVPPAAAENTMDVASQASDVEEPAFGICDGASGRYIHVSSSAVAIDVSSCSRDFDGKNSVDTSSGFAEAPTPSRSFNGSDLHQDRTLPEIAATAAGSERAAHQRDWLSVSASSDVTWPSPDISNPLLLTDHYTVEPVEKVAIPLYEESAEMQLAGGVEGDRIEDHCLHEEATAGTEAEHPGMDSITVPRSDYKPAETVDISSEDWKPKRTSKSGSPSECPNGNSPASSKSHHATMQGSSEPTGRKLNPDSDGPLDGMVLLSNTVGMLAAGMGMMTGSSFFGTVAARSGQQPATEQDDVAEAQISDDWGHLEASLLNLSDATDQGTTINTEQQAQLEELVLKMESLASAEEPKALTGTWKLLLSTDVQTQFVVRTISMIPFVVLGSVVQRVDAEKREVETCVNLLEPVKLDVTMLGTLNMNSVKRTAAKQHSWVINGIETTQLFANLKVPKSVTVGDMPTISLSAVHGAADMLHTAVIDAIKLATNREMEVTDSESTVWLDTVVGDRVRICRGADSQIWVFWRHK